MAKAPAECCAKVQLVGAGPGDPGLLTLKAAEALRLADVVLFDALINLAVLEHAPATALLIPVGKRGARPSTPQAEINRLLVEHARAGRRVVRLKGGDPFVFGRGAEEAEALVAAGVPWEVIPGVSAGVAAAAYAGIPLTHRGMASSVAFLTGQQAADPAARPASPCVADTLVIFMCGSTIGRIARDLIAEGRAPETPAALVRWGTWSKQAIHIGTLEQLARNGQLPLQRPRTSPGVPPPEAAGWGRDRPRSVDATDPPAVLELVPALAHSSAASDDAPPTIAIIGDVVSLHTRLDWFVAEATAAPGPTLSAAVGRSR